MKRTVGAMILLTVLLSSFIKMALPARAAELDDIERYGKSIITDSKLDFLYELIADELTGGRTPEKIAVPKERSVSVSELELAMKLFLTDHPEIFWVRNGYSYATANDQVVEISPQYAFTGAELSRARNKLENAVEDIMLGLPTASNYEKALYLHDQIIKRTDYVHSGEHQTAYGALVDGKAVCAGYSAAYQLLLNRAGIAAWTVTGLSRKPGDTIQVSHAWNIVWIDKNVCVYTDVTWDDGGSEAYHYYFNVSKADIKRDHTFAASEEPFLPDCEHEGYSYFDRIDRNVDDNTTVAELAAMFGPAKGGERKAVFCYQGNDVSAFRERLKLRQSALYKALLCGTGECGYRLSIIANEFHMTVWGDFVEDNYLVEVRHDDTVISYEADSQYVEVGREMTAMRFAAKSGYYFPDDYGVPESNGIKVTRLGERELLISGLPTSDTVISLPAAARSAVDDPYTETIVTDRPVATGSSGGEASDRINVDPMTSEFTSCFEFGIPEVSTAALCVALAMCLAMTRFSRK